MSQIKIDIGNGNVITSFIGKDSADKLKPVDETVTIIKSTEVIVGKL
jgi:molybdopterin-binding protein